MSVAISGTAPPISGTRESAPRISLRSCGLQDQISGNGEGSGVFAPNPSFQQDALSFETAFAKISASL